MKKRIFSSSFPMGIGSGGVNMTGCICARPPFPGCVLVAGCNKKDDKKDDIHITVSGGEFYKFNPAAAPENPVENWVADGYVSTKTTYKGKDAWVVTKK